MASENPASSCGAQNELDLRPSEENSHYNHTTLPPPPPLIGLVARDDEPPSDPANIEESPRAHVTLENTENERGDLTSFWVPSPPVIAGPLLQGEPLTFLEFLNDTRCEDLKVALFGKTGTTETSAATMIEEFRKATEYHYFGIASGLLDANKSRRRRALKDFARRAYVGDPERRGLPFWERVAGLIWAAYESLNRLRTQSEKIQRREERRIAGLPAKRKKDAERARVYRARKRGWHSKAKTTAKPTEVTRG
jgi:hypothetical protein